MLTRATGINSLGEIVGRYNEVSGRGQSFLRQGDQFIAFDVPFPGASGTALGINDRDEIVGSYTGSDGHGHGFIKEGSAFTSLDFPTPGVI
jgi:hypothetical protein